MLAAMSHSVPSPALSATEYQVKKRKERPGKETVMVRNKKLHLDAESDSELSPTTSLKCKPKYVTNAGHDKDDPDHVLATAGNFKESLKVGNRTAKTSDAGTLIYGDSQLLPVHRPSPHSLSRLFVSSSQFFGNKDDSRTDILATSSSLVGRASESAVVGRKTDHTENNGPTESSPQTPSREQGLRNRALKVTEEDRQRVRQNCGKAFKMSWHLKDHMNVHTEKKLHTCLTCGKAFKLSKALQHHMTVHREEKPYKCQLCGKAFKGSGDLKKHIRVLL